MLNREKGIFKNREQIEGILSIVLIIALLIDTIAVFIAGYVFIGIISVIGLLAVGLLVFFNLMS